MKETQHDTKEELQNKVAVVKRKAHTAENQADVAKEEAAKTNVEEVKEGQLQMQKVLEAAHANEKC